MQSFRLTPFEQLLAEAPDQARPGAWRDAGLASLPLVFTAGLQLIVPPAGSEVQVLVGGAAGAGLLAGLGAAWRTGWPRWSATWIMYWGLAAGVALMFGAPALGLAKNQQVLEMLAWGVIGLGLPLGLTWAARRDRLYSLLMALPFTLLLWLPTLEFVPNTVRGVVWPVIWLIAAGSAAALIRRGDLQRGLVGTLGVNLLTGLLVAYSRAYLRVYPEYAPAEVRAAVPVFADFLYWFIPNTAALMTLSLGPALAWAIWQLGRLSGPLGRPAGGLVVAGALWALAGHILSFSLYTAANWGATGNIGRLIAAESAYAGPLLSLTGLLLFWRSPAVRRDPQLWWLWLGGWPAGLGLPFVAVMPFWIGSRLSDTAVPFGFLQWHAHPGLAYALAGLWLLSAIALALYTSRRPTLSPPPAPTP